MSYFEAVLETIQEINANLQAVHASIKRQTELLVMVKNQSSANKPQEAAPAPKGITWQEAVTVLAESCAKVDGVDCCLGRCPMGDWCSYVRNGHAPQGWAFSCDKED